MSSIKSLLADVQEASTEEASHDMESGGGSAFINECGVYPTKILNAFLTETKKGGVKLDLMLGGDNIIDLELYIISKKKGKMITTCQMNGKTVSLPSYKMFKQLYFLATGEGLDLAEMELETQDIKYKRYGKDVEVEGDVITALIGKEIQVGIRLEEDYNYEDNEVDKTALKTNKDGDVIYSRELHSVFSKDGFSPVEVIGEAEEAKDVEEVKKFLASDKGIKRVKLEFPDSEEEGEEGSDIDAETEDDEIKF